MRRITLLGLCFLVVLALGATAAAPATQAAEYGRCVAKENGEYKNSSCTKRSPEAENGSFEWEAPPSETEGGIGAASFSNEPGTLTCSRGMEEAAFTGAKTTSTTVVLLGCEADKEPCANLAERGVIRSFAFETTLIDHGEKGPGGREPNTGEVWLAAQNAHGEEAPWFDKFLCENIAYYEVDGSVSGRITPLNVMSSSHTLVFAGGLAEQNLLSTVCPSKEYAKCYYYNLPTIETLEDKLSGEWEIRTNFSQPPTVKAEPVTEIAPTSAVLNATVNPNGGTVSECKFEYGTTSAYGNSAECSPPPGSDKSEPEPVSASLTGLTEGTTYHYRIVATTAGGTSYVADQTFATFVNSASATTKSEKKPAKAEDGPVAATASEGTGTVTVAQYGSNTGGARLLGNRSEYVDVYEGAKSSFAKIEYKDCELNGAKILYWFDPEKGEWQEVTRQTYVAGSPDCIDAVAETSGTSPTVAQMTGTRYGGGGTSDPPEFGKCVTPPPLNLAGALGGFFAKSTCVGAPDEVTTGPEAGEGHGKYEWEQESLEQRAATKTQPAQSAVHFTLSASSVKLETAVKAFKVTCTGASGEGEYTGPKTIGSVTLTFTGCTQGSEKCTNGGNAEEIKTKTLEGVLGWEAETSNKVGLELHPSSGAFMEFSCGATSIAVRGGVIAPLKANKASATPALKFKGSKGKQKPEGFENEPKAFLEESSNAGASYEAMDLSTSITQTVEKATAVEVNTEH